MQEESLARIIMSPGSQIRPELNSKHFRMYTHNLCPYATRARYAFALKQVPFQSVEMDLDKKAQFHLDANGGFVPLLETTTGEHIKESAIIAQLAIEMHKGKGVELIPEDPLEAARMRLMSVKFDGMLSAFYKVLRTRGLDPEANQGLIPLLQTFNKQLEAANGNYLFGTPEPTLLDVNFCPFLEIISDWQHTEFSNIHEEIDYKTNGSLIDGYVAKMRARPDIHPERMRTAAFAAQQARARTFPMETACNLWSGYFEEVYAAEK